MSKLLTLTATILLAAATAALGQSTPSLDDSAMQATHSRIYGDYATGTTWQQVSADEHGTTNIILRKTIHPEDIGGSYHPDNPPLISGQATIIRNQLAANDLAVRMRFTANEAHLTAKQDFVYSDFSGVVEQVFSDSGHTVTQGQTLVVTRPGGTVQVNQYTISGVDSNFPPYRLNQDYILFLKRVPGTDSYRATADNSYVMTDNGVMELARLSPRLPKGTLLPENQFLVDMQSAIDTTNKGRGGRQ